MSADTPQSRLREQLRQKRTDFILEAAEEIIIRKGYYSTSMDEIAAQAGVAKGTLYHHFPTKEDLFLALIERALAHFEQVVRQAVLSSENARQKLEHILFYVYGEHRREHGYLLQLLRRNGDLNLRLQAKKGLSGEHVDQVVDQIRRIFEEGKAEGIFATNVTTDLMVHFFLHLLSLSGDEHLPEQQERTLEELIPQLEHLLFRGIQSS